MNVVSASYGYLLGDYTEPFVEILYRTSQEKIEGYTSKARALDWGLGMLFNIPGRNPGESGGSRSEMNAPAFSQATWIPYGGIMLNSESFRESASTESSGREKSDFVTKLIFGVRWIPAPHVGLNFGIRASHQKRSDLAETGESQGGETARTTVESRLFAVSLLF